MSNSDKNSLPEKLAWSFIPAAVLVGSVFIYNSYQLKKVSTVDKEARQQITEMAVASRHQWLLFLQMKEEMEKMKKKIEELEEKLKKENKSVIKEVSLEKIVKPSIPKVNIFEKEIGEGEPPSDEE